MMARVILPFMLLLWTGCYDLGLLLPPDEGEPRDLSAGGNDLSASANYVATVLADSPVVYYRVGEIGGTQAFDRSGFGRTGTYQGGGVVMLGQSGAIAGDSDTAVFLSGAGNFADGGTNNDANVGLPLEMLWGGDFTIEAWVKPQAPPAGAHAALLIWEQYLVRGFRAGWTETLTPNFDTGESGGATSRDGTVSMMANAWNHLVFTFTQSGRKLAMYVNGAPAGSATFSDYIAPTGVDENAAWGASEGVWSVALFDELAIYDTALSASRVAAHYVAGK